MRQPGAFILFSVASLCTVVIGGLVRDQQDRSASAQRVLQSSLDTPLPKEQLPKLHGKFLHITDIHPDAFYKTHSSTDENYACHRGEGPAGYYGAETSDCDTPFSLVNATFKWIAEHFKDQVDFVIWTGDSARHDSDERIPRSAKQVLGTNAWIADKFTEVFYDKETNALSVPVIPTFGNNDILPHNIMMPGPNRWLQEYTSIWRHFIPEEQRHSFELGGWFYVEVIPNRLAVFSLNTLYFFDRNAAVDDCIDPSEPGFKQLEWLRVQLQFMRERGMKAILTGHVPPARTPSKVLWDESCWQKYTLWLQQYRDVVTASIYGHMNIDHFLLQDTEEVDIHKLTAGILEDANPREPMDDELTAQGANDYLVELRDLWSKLPKEAGKIDVHRLSVDKKRGKGKKKLGGPWGERYQVSMVGPSVVPNFFPTLRMVEYNITGLENSNAWKGPALTTGATPAVSDVYEHEAGLRKAALAEIEKKKKNKNKKNKGGKKHKPERPKDPNLVIPEPPSKSAPPGPAYSPQTLTLVGYTQYFANLTYINNDVVDHPEKGVEADRWRHGKHRGKKPNKSPDPREFQFEEEYNTYKDQVMKLPDLTVSSYLKLAYRMGQRDAKAKSLDAESFEEIADEDGLENEDDEYDPYNFADEKDSRNDHDDNEDNDDSEGEMGQYRDGTVREEKLKKDKHLEKHNKVWLHFLKHAFVSTVDMRDLKKLDH